MRLTKAAAAEAAAALGHSGSLCLGLVSFPCHLLLCFVLCHLSLSVSVSPSLAVVEPVNARVRFLVVRLEVALPAAVQMPPSGFTVFTIFPIYLTHPLCAPQGLFENDASKASLAAAPEVHRTIGRPASPPLSLFLFLYLCLALSWGLLLIKCVVRTTSGAHCSF